jgi:hypothetical protein
MISRKPLKALYEGNSAATAVGIDELGDFFRKTLHVPNVSAHYLILEIEVIKREHGLEADPKILHQHYRLLREFSENDERTAVQIRSIVLAHAEVSSPL